MCGAVCAQTVALFHDYNVYTPLVRPPLPTERGRTREPDDFDTGRCAQSNAYCSVRMVIEKNHRSGQWLKHMNVRVLTLNTFPHFDMIKEIAFIFWVLGEPPRNCWDLGCILSIWVAFFSRRQRYRCRQGWRSARSKSSLASTPTRST